MNKRQQLSKQCYMHPRYQSSNELTALLLLTANLALMNNKIRQNYPLPSGKIVVTASKLFLAYSYFHSHSVQHMSMESLENSCHSVDQAS